jgi:hypothetical protein
MLRFFFTKIKRKIKMLTKKPRQKRYVEEFELSNLSQAEFCRRNNLACSTFSGWKKKYGAIKEKINFVELPIFNTNISTCKIKRADGAELTVTASDGQLSNLVQVFLCSK